MKSNGIFPRSIRIALIMSSLYCVQANAQVATFGVTDCGQWIASTTDTRKAWLLGYLSGINTVRATNKRDPLDKINSAEQIFLWMNNYCQENPLKSVRDGAHTLYLELEKK